MCDCVCKESQAIKCVCFRYNNKTYRIDDIAWDKNPQSTFLDHKGNAICFMDYYKSVLGRQHAILNLCLSAKASHLGLLGSGRICMCCTVLVDCRNVYGKVIHDEEQPLLIHRPKVKDRRDPVSVEFSVL